jgi:hypothetical protein
MHIIRKINISDERAVLADEDYPHHFTYWQLQVIHGYENDFIASLYEDEGVDDVDAK